MVEVLGHPESAWTGEDLVLGQLCPHNQLQIKILTKVQMSFLGWQYELLCVTPYLVGRIKHWARWLCWEKRTGSFAPGLSAPCDLFYCWFKSLSFVVINLNNEYNCFAKFLSSSGESLNWRVVLGTPKQSKFTAPSDLTADPLHSLVTRWSKTSSQFQLLNSSWHATPDWLFWHSPILRSVKCFYFSLLFLQG